MSPNISSLTMALATPGRIRHINLQCLVKSGEPMCRHTVGSPIPSLNAEQRPTRTCVHS